LAKFEPYLYSNDLQFGFKKKIGCGPAMFTIQQVANYFSSRGCSIYITAIDASKAFDRINHDTLFHKLLLRKLPFCFIGVIMDWYGKLYSCVR